jgi:hypothetical protein
MGQEHVKATAEAFQVSVELVDVAAMLKDQAAHRFMSDPETGATARKLLLFHHVNHYWVGVPPADETNETEAIPKRARVQEPSKDATKMTTSMAMQEEEQQEHKDLEGNAEETERKPEAKKARKHEPLHNVGKMNQMPIIMTGDNSQNSAVHPMPQPDDDDDISDLECFQQHTTHFKNQYGPSWEVQNWAWHLDKYTKSNKPHETTILQASIERCSAIGLVKPIAGAALTDMEEWVQEHCAYSWRAAKEEFEKMTQKLWLKLHRAKQRLTQE